MQRTVLKKWGAIVLKSLVTVYTILAVAVFSVYINMALHYIDIGDLVRGITAWKNCHTAGTPKN